MKKAVAISISVTEAARNFAECVNRAHYQGASFILLKNDKPLARLVPADDKVCTGRNLADALAATTLAPAEARAWQRDLAAARKSPRKPADKWR